LNDSPTSREHDALETSGKRDKRAFKNGTRHKVFVLLQKLPIFNCAVSNMTIIGSEFPLVFILSMSSPALYWIWRHLCGLFLEKQFEKQQLMRKRYRFPMCGFEKSRLFEVHRSS